ncbi:MAG TPA: hypothetical protein VLG12_07100 [Candidatus Saccharimonadales bacterium]|nr:hypothetical protein [Candidatus Saccharimonadales bacterium]
MENIHKPSFIKFQYKRQSSKITAIKHLGATSGGGTTVKRKVRIIHSWYWYCHDRALGIKNIRWIGDTNAK